MRKNNMLLTDEEVSERLIESEVPQNFDTPDDLAQVRHPARGGGAGRELTDEQRFAVGILGKTVGPVQASRETGVSPQHIVDLTRGRRRNDNKLIESDKNFGEMIQAKKESISGHVLDKCMAAVEGIDVDEVDNPMKKAHLAEKMVKIFAGLNGSAQNAQGPQTAIIFNTPEARKIDNCKVIDIDQ